jgi:hypothetical protein
MQVEEREGASMSVLKAGTRLKSAVCNTEVMVVMAPKEPVEVKCGGTPLIEMGADKPEGGSILEGADGGTQMGKRYVNEAGDLELLCTKPGDGALSTAGALLNVKGAKPLPSSD